jgi:UDPglucose 6-dehydrogenase
LNICMIGAGYVGLVSAACFSNFGWHVHCIDKDADKVAGIADGRMPIYEPGLDELVERNIKAGRLKFSTELAQAVGDADLVFLAVGTPMRRGDGYADLRYVYQAVAEMAPHLSDFTVVTTKSTVPVGTSREIERRLRELRPDADFAVCSNPEFLREGSAIQDFTHPDRVLVGVDDDRAKSRMERVYEPLRLRSAPVIFVGREAAELAKYAANAFLAMKISFINEISDLCEEVGADVQQVATAIGSDRRIGDKFLHPGPGYGGSCFPKDVSALARTGREARAPLSLVEQVEKVNIERKIAMIPRIERAAGGEVRGKTIACLGVTFKPNTDDMRESPSLVILPMLMERGAVVRAYDPQGRQNAEPLLPGVAWADDALEAAEDADLLVILTEWNEFRALNLRALKDRMRGRIIVDLRNVMRPEFAAEEGFAYYGIGRSADRPRPEPRSEQAHDPDAPAAASQLDEAVETSDV